MSSTALRILFVCSFFCLMNNAWAKEEGKLHFVPNKGQWPEKVLYKAELEGGDVFFTQQGFRYSFYSLNDLKRAHLHESNFEDSISCHAYDVIFANSKPQLVEGNDKSGFYHNYFLGNDTAKWAYGVPVYQKVIYTGLYEHIGINIYSKGTSLKYDLVVEPGGRVGDILMLFDGVTPIINKNGDLEITTSVNTIIEQAPYAYQVLNGVEIPVPCRFVMNEGRLSFDFPEGYNKSVTLVIDPVIVFATYTGSTGTLWGYCSAYDAQGRFYSGSEAYASGFPVTVGAFQTSYNLNDIAINKYSAGGDSLLYSTYCGGALREHPTAMAVNGNDELVISGQTFSSDYPVTTGAFDATINNDATASDIFVTVFNSSGSNLVGSTYIGGAAADGISSYAFHDNDQNKSGLCVDAQNNIYVATSTLSKNFPVTVGAFQTTAGAIYDGCVFKLSRTCSSLLYSTYLGGNHQDCIYDCKLAGGGRLAVCGRTISDDFPLSSNAYADTGNAFVSIISSSGGSLVASTKLGTYSESGLKLSLDDNKNVFVCGNNDTGMLVHAGTYNHPKGKIFIAKLTPGLDSMIRLTKLVNMPKPGVTGFVSICGDVVVTLYLKDTGSLPTTSNAYQSGYSAYYFFHLSPGMDSLIYATYFGALNDSIRGGHAHGSSTIDTNGVIWLSTCNLESKHLLPGTTGSYCPTSKSPAASGYDHLSVKFDMEVLAVKPIAGLEVSDTTCINSDVLFENQSVNAYSYLWDFGDGDTSHAKSPVHQYTTTGNYVVKLEAYNPYSCKVVDVVYDTIYVDSIRVESEFIVADTVCISAQANMTNKSIKGKTYLWDFGDGGTATTFNAQHVFTTPGTYTIKLMAYNPDLCNRVDTSYKVIIVDTTNPGAEFSVSKTTACVGLPIQFQNLTARGLSYQWDFGDGSSSVLINPTHSYTTGGTQIVRLIASNNNLCVPHDTAYFPVEVLPPLQIELADTFVCGDSPVNWGVKLLHGNSLVTYKWEPANAILSATNLQSVTINPKISTKYIVTVTDSIPGMCSHTRTDTGNVIIVEYPAGTFAHSNTPICEGDTLMLETGTTSNVQGIVYSWTGPEGFSSNTKYTERTKTTRIHSGTYTAAIDNNGCKVYEDVQVLVKPVPFVKATSNSPVFAGYELKLSMTADMALDSLFWTGPDNFFSYEANPSINPVGHEAGGTYTVQAMLNGCAGGAIVIVRIDEPDSQYVRIYPNPNNGTFYIEGKGHNEQEIKMLVINSIGQEIYRSNARTEKKHFRHKVVLPAVSGGVYIMWLLMDGKYWPVPFTILRD